MGPRHEANAAERDGEDCVPRDRALGYVPVGNACEGSDQGVMTDPDRVQVESGGAIDLRRARPERSGPGELGARAWLQRSRCADR